MSTEMTEIHGGDGNLPDGTIVIVASRYNASICDALVTGAVETLRAAGLDDSTIRVVRVPGAWELPLASANAADDESVLGVVALGAVIEGETTHDQHINRAVSDALMNLGLRTGKPIGFGLLTCRSLEQAINRSGGTVGNKGEEAAGAVIEMLRLAEKVKTAAV
ncbi:6,7-dimethyl-8-ribityllumazine synthase [Crateriforma conspicua]|uniref:6,7-dimethyl-8-ribityllumazine synthase n=2 Tax=Crateriforma conspicua TaxID=2527996 RepID=A0A5C5Y4B9_9PLAN|nr:6,7-dimethyl-8-ribityllumazine synthase [Crateriforma conspicua]QDV64090.1 6,7-dimethyl-8-ribityllumazine synthase [Crateriforma conspicua]TWT69481.1 6,7-dimethyl-8-ribityllumazine synthase [Crateriforma conspicua]